MKYYWSSIIVSVLGLIAAAWLGWSYEGTIPGVVEFTFYASILAVLEVSLSFDNAVVNAAVLRNMTPEWRHRFITWGMLIAVFGMRLVFPLAIVSIIGDISPWSALVLAAKSPTEYAQMMLKSHLVVTGFGGAFLLMVALKYFFDVTKDVHWIQAIEYPLSKLGKIEAIEMGICLLTLYFLSRQMPLENAHSFLIAGAAGLITFIVVDGISAFLEAPDGSGQLDAARASFGMFLYLEVLDASFSFDGVVGAFAITHNLFLIAIGLGIGAMFVRSLTIMLVEEGTLSQFRFLEHGAFYAIGALAGLMLLDSVVHVPEAVTGLVGAAFIAVSLLSSILFNRRGRKSH